MSPITNQQLEADFEATAPDAHVVAEEWVNAAAKIKPTVPRTADLAEMITGIGLDFTMQGAPEIEIDIYDEDWVLLDSGFFDPEDKGTLDRIDINYPQGSRYHWRIFQFSPRADFTVQTYWIPRVVGDMMSTHGPFSASRSSRTRAEFLKMAVLKAAPYANFYSRQLDVVQAIAPVSIPASSSGQSAPATSGSRKVGISSATVYAGLTVKGAPMGKRQADNASVLLRVADQNGAGKVATEALIYAAIWESNLEIYASNGSFWGVLSGKIGVWNQADTAGMAKAFLLGDSQKGFQGGGAIALASQGLSPVAIAQKVEAGGSYASEKGYPGDAKAIAEVDAIIEAGGGAIGSGGVAGAAVEAVQQYNFQIGTSQDPHEDFWTGSNRMAQEVNWELVVDGDDVYYDNDVQLCRAAIALQLDRTDQAVDDWTYDWDRTMLPTNFQLVLQCGLFDFRAADVFKLTRFGPASAGSSCGLPGRWLVGEIQRNPGDVVSTFTLVQPTKPLKEPAPQTGNVTTIKGGVTLTGKGVNPFSEATNLQPRRVDDGKDYAMAPGSPILAPFDSKFLFVRPWGGAAGSQPFMAFEIVGGSYNGWNYYFAEQITPATFKTGQIIKAGTVIATYAPSGSAIECGLAGKHNPNDTLAQENGHGGEVPSPEGLLWEKILKALGAPV